MLPDDRLRSKLSRYRWSAGDIPWRLTTLSRPVVLTKADQEWNTARRLTHLLVPVDLLDLRVADEM